MFRSRAGLGCVCVCDSNIETYGTAPGDGARNDSCIGSLSESNVPAGSKNSILDGMILNEPRGIKMKTGKKKTHLGSSEGCGVARGMDWRADNLVGGCGWLVVGGPGIPAARPEPDQVCTALYRW